MAGQRADLAKRNRLSAGDPAGTMARQVVGRRSFLTGAAGVGLAGVLAACSSGGAGGGSKGSGSGEAVKDPLAVPGGPKTTRRTDVIYPPGYVGPMAAKKGPCTRNGKTVTLRVVVPQNTSVGNWTKNKFTDYFEQQTHVHIDWQVVPSGDDTMTKVNAMIATGDLPDAFMAVPFTPSQLYVYGQQGLFTPQQDLLKQYAPETMRVFRDYPETEKLLTTPDGNIYSSPYVNDCYHCKYSAPIWIYTPYLEKLGLSMPQTTDDMVKVLKAFKTQQPAGPGVDVTPMSGSQDDGRMSDYFMGSFLYNPADPWLFLDNGKVDIAIDKPEWREGWRYIRSLVSQGLIDTHAFTQSNDQLRRQTAGGKKAPPVAVIRAYYWGSWQDLNDNDPNAQFRDFHEVPTPKGPNGVQVTPWSYYNWLGTAHFVITSKCKNPGVAVSWADSQKELTNMLQTYNGVGEGKYWRYAKKGEIGFTGDQGLWLTIGTWPPPNGSWWGQQGVDYRSMDFRNGEVVDRRSPTFELQFYKDTKDAGHPLAEPKDQQLPPLYLSDEQASVAADVSVPISNQVAKMESQFCLGQADIDDDKQWNTYLDSLKKIGVEHYLQSYQDAYDAWRKATANK